MALPKLDAPIYDIELPLSKLKVKFRPFLVKEEKILLMAIEADDSDTIMSAIKQIVNNCCISDIDIEKLPILDLEFFFLHLRARSIGEVAELRYKCNNTIGEGEEAKPCNHVIEFKLNVLEIEPIVAPEHNNKIQLTPKLGVCMKYPSLSSIENKKEGTDVNGVFELIYSCIDYIYDETELYYAKDATKEELVDFVDSLDKNQLLEIKKFFDTIPKLTKKLHFVCEKCKYEEDIVLEGIQNFFV